MSDVLVIRVNIDLEPRELDNLRVGVERMRKTGVVVLPDYCKVVTAPEDCEIKIEDSDGNEVKEQKICKYYTEKMSQLIDKCRKLYQYPGWTAGGELHIVLDDGNLEDTNINFGYASCRKRIVEPAAALGMDICTDLLSMTLTEREIFYYIWSNEWNGICEHDKECDICEYYEERRED